MKTHGYVYVCVPFLHMTHICVLNSHTEICIHTDELYRSVDTYVCIYYYICVFPTLSTERT